MKPGVRTRLELPPGGAIGFRDDLSVIRRVGHGLHPGTPGHTSGKLQRGGVTQVNITAGTIETQRTSIFSSGGPSRSIDRATNAMTGSIGHRVPRSFLDSL